MRRQLLGCECGPFIVEGRINNRVVAATGRGNGRCARLGGQPWRRCCSAAGTVNRRWRQSLCRVDRQNLGSNFRGLPHALPDCGGDRPGVRRAMPRRVPQAKELPRHVRRRRAGPTAPGQGSPGLSRRVRKAQLCLQLRLQLQITQQPAGWATTGGLKRRAGSRR